MTLGTSLYVKNSVEAVELYMKVFGLDLGYHVMNPDGTYFHSELYKNGEQMLSVVESSNPCTEHTIQLCIEFGSEDEVRQAYALLSEGGTIDLPIGPLPWSPCAASVIDRFGVWWYLSTCSHQPPEGYDFWSEK